MNRSDFCRWCGMTKGWHRNNPSDCRMGFSPQPKPSCRVCGKTFNPASSGRDDCCYRHRMDS